MIMEVDVDTNDERDARRVAEGTVEHLIERSCPVARGVQPVIKWQHRNGNDYEVTLVRRPIELGAAARNGIFTVDVPQPLLESGDDD